MIFLWSVQSHSFFYVKLRTLKFEVLAQWKLATEQESYKDQMVQAAGFQWRWALSIFLLDETASN